LILQNRELPATKIVVQSWFNVRSMTTSLVLETFFEEKVLGKILLVNCTRFPLDMSVQTYNKIGTILRFPLDIRIKIWGFFIKSANI